MSKIEVHDQNFIQKYQWIIIALIIGLVVLGYEFYDNQQKELKVQKLIENKAKCLNDGIKLYEQKKNYAMARFKSGEYTQPFFNEPSFSFSQELNTCLMYLYYTAYQSGEGGCRINSRYIVDVYTNQNISSRDWSCGTNTWEGKSDSEFRSDLIKYKLY